MGVVSVVNAGTGPGRVSQATGGHFDDVDLVAELENDLLDHLVRREDVDAHARDRTVFGRSDVQGLDVVAAARDEADDAREDARLVLHIAVETMDMLVHLDAPPQPNTISETDLPPGIIGYTFARGSTMTSTTDVLRDAIAFLIVASSFAGSMTR